MLLIVSKEPYGPKKSLLREIDDALGESRINPHQLLRNTNISIRTTKNRSLRPIGARISTPYSTRNSNGPY